MTAAGVAVLVALVSGVAAALAVHALVPPPARLADRVRPYTAPSRSALGYASDLDATSTTEQHRFGGILGRLFGPLVQALADRLGRLVDGSGEERILLRLRQADHLGDVPESLRVQEYRIRQLGNAAAGAALGAAALAAVGSSAAAALLGLLLGFVTGVTRWRARIDRTIQARRQRMRIELYTVNQLLAMNVRVGGGVIHAARRVVDRGRGEIVAELREALVAHETGVPAAEAFQRIARSTPEPNAARTYNFLATGAQWGADLASGLRALSEDVRDARREALKRQATRRRAAMLVPIIAVLAPVMLLFIAAPLPSLIFGVA